MSLLYIPVTLRYRLFQPFSTLLPFQNSDFSANGCEKDWSGLSDPVIAS